MQKLWRLLRAFVDLRNAHQLSSLDAYMLQEYMQAASTCGRDWFTKVTPNWALLLKPSQNQKTAGKPKFDGMHQICK